MTVTHRTENTPDTHNIPETPEGHAVLAFLRGVSLSDAAIGNGTTITDLEPLVREAFERTMIAEAEVQRLRDLLIALGSHRQGIAAMTHVTVRQGEGLRVIVTSATTDERWLAGRSTPSRRPRMRSRASRAPRRSPSCGWSARTPGSPRGSRRPSAWSG